MWTEQEAKANFEEILLRALSGDVQIIGEGESCVLISLDEYKRLKTLEDEPHPGRWLVKHLAGLGEIELPPREENRPSPFADWTEEELKD